VWAATATALVVGAAGHPPNTSGSSRAARCGLCLWRAGKTLMGAHVGCSKARNGACRGRKAHAQCCAQLSCVQAHKREAQRCRKSTRFHLHLLHLLVTCQPLTGGAAGSAAACHRAAAAHPHTLANMLGGQKLRGIVVLCAYHTPAVCCLWHPLVCVLPWLAWCVCPAMLQNWPVAGRNALQQWLAWPVSAKSCRGCDSKACCAQAATCMRGTWFTSGAPEGRSTGLCH
jgi:hypothetical protein